MSAQTLSFQAEVSRLLDIVAHSLYSEREVFLRELVANAADACDKLRYLALTTPDLLAGDSSFAVDVTIHADKRQIVVSDNGIGMDRQELIDHLGTIARSGTGAFMQSAEQTGSGERPSLIGQFGVGFYAAFMVARQVTVISRKAGEADAWQWQSDGKGEFTVTSTTRSTHGTDIILDLREDADEYLAHERLEDIVRRYSDHIALPVYIRVGDAVRAEAANKASALWTRPRSEITDTEYQEFYRYSAHAWDDPWATLHWHAEGMIEYDALLYIPATRPHDLFDPARRERLRLYVKRVFITDQSDGLIPPFLRFVRGVIDSADLPLNISREMLQQNPLVKKIRQGVTRKILGELQKRAQDAPESYEKFWQCFGVVLKEGLYEDNDHRNDLLKLSRFYSTKFDGLVSLDDYLKRMRPGQNHIFYMTGTDIDVLRRSPQIEGFLARDVEVLLLTDPIDEFWVPMVIQHEDKAFKSVTRAGVDLQTIEAPENSETPAPPPETATITADLDGLVTRLKEALGATVKDVRRSARLTDSPVCLVADDGDLDINLVRLLRANKQMDKTIARVLEINPDHAVIRALASDSPTDAAEFGDIAQLLLDQARIMDGEPLPDPSGFSRRLAGLMGRILVKAA